MCIRDSCRYAAVATLVNIGTPDALSIINTKAVQGFLLRVCIPEIQGGGVKVHEHGERDLRSCYLAVATAHMLSMDTTVIAERAAIVQFVKHCQTYEV